MKTKLALSIIIASLIVGCGSNNSTIQESKNSSEINTTMNRSSDGKGAGIESGIGILTEYNGAYAPIAGEDKKLFALYLLGSDLERKGNAGTNDLNEIVAGYNSLNDQQKSKLDIIIAFGGANKDNWRGNFSFFT